MGRRRAPDPEQVAVMKPVGSQRKVRHLKNATYRYNWLMLADQLLSFCLFYIACIVHLHVQVTAVAGTGKEQESKVWKVSSRDVAIR